MEENPDGGPRAVTEQPLEPSPGKRERPRGRSERPVRGRWRILRLLPAVPGVVLVASIVVWLAFPSPFVHGLVIGALAGFVVWLAVVAGAILFFKRLRERAEAGLRPPPLPSSSWDYAMEAETLDGEVVPFSKFQGRVLILNFWATWCAPCLAEIPSLERLRGLSADLDVEMACVTRESREVVEKFLAKRKLDVPIYFLRGETPAVFGSRGIPATFILDRTGQIALRHVGAAQWDDERVVAFVRGLAAKPSA